MTTLPQTTPMRLPRTVSPTQLTAPGGPGPGGMMPPPGAPGGAGLTGSDALRVLRTNWWLILLFVVAGAVGGYFLNGYLARHHSRYTAEGYVRIQTEEESISGRDVPAFDARRLEIEQRTQAEMLVHPGLLLTVLSDANSEIRETEWLKQFGPNLEAAKEDLLKHFDVSPIANSRLISVSMTYSRPADSKTVVEEIVNQHIRQQRERVNNKWSERVKHLDAQREATSREHDDLLRKLTKMSADLGSQGMAAGGGTSVLSYEYHRLVDSQAQAQKDLAEAENAYNMTAALVNAGQVTPKVEEMILKDPVVNDYRRAIDDLEVAIGADAAGGDENRRMVSLRQRLEAYERKLDERREEIRSQASTAALEEASGEIAAAKKDLARIEERVVTLRQELARTQRSFNEYALLETQEKVMRAKLDKVEDEINEIKRERLPADWAPVMWAQNPQTPETPSFPKLYITLPAAVFVGLALSLGIAFLRELTDTSVRTPRDIARVGQMNLLGIIPHDADDPQAAGARHPLVIFDAPHSLSAEEFRKLRTRLAHTAALDTTRSILVTGSSPGDGKTTVACNLAAGLALNGRRILLVDANFRRPELHKVFGMENAHGFSDVLNSLDAFDDHLQETQVPNLTVLTSGVKPSNATELLESQLLIDFVERALEEFDHVIFDTGALLVVSETLAMAPRVDGVVTVVRARANSRGVLLRMRDTLRQVKAEHLGVVLNGVRAHKGGYYNHNIRTYYQYQNA